MQELFESIDPTTTIVTGTSRLSRHLTDRYNRWNMVAGNEVWETPDILPWTVFVDRAWRDWVARDPGDAAEQIVLRPSQEQALWEQVIRDSLPQDERHLFQVPATARAASAAYRMATSWNLASAALEGSTSGDVRQFVKWIEEFDKRCEAERLLPLAKASTRLVAWCRTNTPPQITRLIHAGFDQVTPQQRELMQALRDSDVTVEQLDAERFEAQVSQIGFATRVDESNAAARWARLVLDENPEARVGIVVPDLESVRTRVAADLANVLDSGNDTPHAGGRSSLFHLSLGAPLSEAPVVFAGLTALRFILDPLSVNDVGVVLRSPFFADAVVERDGRAQLDLLLRRDGQDRVTLSSLIWLATEHKDGRQLAPRFGEHLVKLFAERKELVPDSRARRTTTEWAEIFTRWHSLAGWGKGRELDSEEFQAREAYNDLVSDFCALDLVVDQMSAAEAIAQMERLADERVHQPRARPAPVEVMGVIESGGLAFSHLWLMGMTDDVWPRPARPNPFLPVDAQRKAGVAASDAALGLSEAQEITERLLQSAPIVVVSHATADGENPLRMSPLFSHLPTRESDDIDSRATVERVNQLVAAAPTLEVQNDHRAPALQHVTRGGTGIFKDQSNCAFRAFAVHRLNARGPGDLTSGLDAIERGQLVHEVMDQFWQVTRNLAGLKALNEQGELNGSVSRAVATAVEARAKLQRLKYTDAVIEMETERLIRVVLDWLALELKRPAFSIESVEAGENHDVGGINVTMRIDRVDRLESGKLFIIDYKTGQVDVNDWADYRPRDPQLLVYAAALGVDTIEAMAFARLRVGNNEFAGLGDDDTSIDGVKSLAKTGKKLIKKQGYDDLGQMLRTTTGIVHRLAKEFSDGDALVDPLKGSCDYCELTSFCRFYEGQLETDEPMEGESSGGRS